LNFPFLKIYFKNNFHYAKRLRSVIPTFASSKEGQAKVTSTSTYEKTFPITSFDILKTHPPITRMYADFKPYF
jgi:hypothetical protein